MATQSSTLYATNIRHMMTDLTPEKDGKINHNMEDDVIRGATVAFEGEITFPPPPPKVQAIAAKPKEKVKELTPEEKRRRSRDCRLQGADQAAGHAAAVGGALMLVGWFAPASFMQHFIVFVLSVFVGFQVIWNVSHSLHTPLMAVTNAISSIIILGALMQIGSRLLADHHPGGAVGLHGGHQHLRWLPGHPAHARHVPEVIRGRGNGIRIHHRGLRGRGCPLHPVTGRPVGPGKRQARGLVRHRRHGAGGRRHPDRPGCGPRLLSMVLIARRAAVGYQLAQRVQMTQMPELVPSCTRWSALRPSSSASTPTSRSATWPLAAAGREGEPMPAQGRGNGLDDLHTDRQEDPGRDQHPARSSCSSASGSAR
jgi:hypothetical protein